MKNTKFKTFRHEKMTFDQHCKAWPTEFIQEGPAFGNISVYRSVIPYTHTESSIVYFVTSSKGDEHGQFATLEEAMEKADQVREAQSQPYSWMSEREKVTG